MSAQEAKGPRIATGNRPRTLNAVNGVASQNKAAPHSVMKADLLREKKRTRERRRGGGRERAQNLDRKRNERKAERRRVYMKRKKRREMQQKNRV